MTRLLPILATLALGYDSVPLPPDAFRGEVAPVPVEFRSRPDVDARCQRAFGLDLPVNQFQRGCVLRDGCGPVLVILPYPRVGDTSYWRVVMHELGHVKAYRSGDCTGEHQGWEFAR